MPVGQTLTRALGRKPAQPASSGIIRSAQMSNLMRILFLSIMLTFCHVVPAAAQPDNSRTDIVYMIGQVIEVTNRSVRIDLGEAHTIEPRDDLAAFRSVDGYFKPIGRIPVTKTEATQSMCETALALQRGDLVMTVRELHQLQTGRKHRIRTLKREVIRSYSRPSHSSFANVALARALSDYELSYPNWEKAPNAIEGRMLTASLQGPRTSQLDQLERQLALMRRFYRQSSLAVASAGENWASVMHVLAGPTAAAGHLLLQENAEEEGIQISASELRERVTSKVFHLQPEQQNMVAMIVAVLTTENRSNIRSFLTAIFPQTQFPSLKEDTQLVLDIEDILRELPANS